MHRSTPAPRPPVGDCARRTRRRPRGRCRKSAARFSAVSIIPLIGAESPRGLRHFATAVESVVQHLIAGPRAPARGRRVVLDVAHRLDAAGDDDIGRAGLHRHGRRDDRLQAAAATAVDLQTGHLTGSPRAERPTARCTAPRSWHRTARRPRPRCAPGSTPLRCTIASTTLRREVFGPQRAQAAAEAADGSTDRGDDRGASHAFVTPPTVGGRIEKVGEAFFRAARRSSPVPGHRGSARGRCADPPAQPRRIALVSNRLTPRRIRFRRPADAGDVERDRHAELMLIRSGTPVSGRGLSLSTRTTFL